MVCLVQLLVYHVNGIWIIFYVRKSDGIWLTVAVYINTYINTNNNKNKALFNITPKWFGKMWRYHALSIHICHVDMPSSSNTSFALSHYFFLGQHNIFRQFRTICLCALFVIVCNIIGSAAAVAVTTAITTTQNKRKSKLKTNTNKQVDWHLESYEKMNEWVRIHYPVSDLLLIETEIKRTKKKKAKKRQQNILCQKLIFI